MGNADYLNSLNADPEVEGGRVVTLSTYLDSDRNFTNPIELTAEQYEKLGLDPTDLGCLEEHPEGSDRGGYVPTLTNGCYFAENDGEWYDG